MLLPGCALFNPSSQERNLTRVQGIGSRSAALTTRHTEHRIGGGDAGNDLATGWIPRDDRMPVAPERAFRAFFEIETERGLRLM